MLAMPEMSSKLQSYLFNDVKISGVFYFGMMRVLKTIFVAVILAVSSVRPPRNLSSGSY